MIRDELGSCIGVGFPSERHVDWKEVKQRMQRHCKRRKKELESRKKNNHINRLRELGI